MTDPIAWALFGNKDGGHGLIDSSGASSELLGTIRWHTDLPPLASASWQPYFAGYRVGEHYIIQRTAPDDQADRPGMVVTRVAIYQNAALEEADFRDLKAGVGVALAGSGAASTDAVAGAIDALASSRESYWIGDDTFDSAVEHIWRLLGYRDRVNFVFGQVFSPSSVPYLTTEDSIALYLVPAAHRTRFDESRTIDSSRAPEPGMTALAVMRGHSDVATDLGISVPSLSQWRMVAAVEAYCGRLNSLSHEEARTCVHLLSTLAIGGAGQELKERVAERLKEISPMASFGDIRSCRNLPFESVPNLDLASVLGSWCERVVGPKRRADLAAAIASFGSPSESDFEEALASALRTACIAMGDELTDRMLEAIEADDPETFIWLVMNSTRSSSIDRGLAEGTRPDSREWLHVEARKIRLPETHAACCPLTDPIAAWRLHLATGLSTAPSRSRLAARCDGEDLISAALGLGGAHLTELAGRAVADGSAHLPTDASPNQDWLRILASAVRAGADPWAHIDPQTATHPVFGAYLDGDEDLLILVAALAHEGAVHVLRLERRPEIWSKVPEPHRSALLTRTALAATLSGETSGSESALVEAMCSDTNMRAVALLDVTRAVDALESLAPRCDSQSAIAIAENAVLDEASRRLGKVIAERRWTAAARFVINNPHRLDLRQAADECRHILPALERIMSAVMSGSRPSRQELGEGLLDVATSLYPTGPQHNSLWDRSGGNVADLATAGTGRNQWTKAIAAILDGSAGAPSLANLLSTMMDDYPANSSLKNLGEVLL